MAVPTHTIIALHGFGQSARSWDELSSLLPAGVRLQAFDLPGHGARGGERDVAAYALEAICREVREAARTAAERDGAEPVLLGYSQGGRIALETLVRHGANLPISALVLESAGLGPTDEETRVQLAQRNGAWARRVRDEGLEPFMDWWANLSLFASQRALPVERQAILRAGRLDNDAEGLALAFEQYGQHRQASAVESLRALRAAAQRMPVMYVAGELDEKYCAVGAEVARACAGHEVGGVEAPGLLAFEAGFTFDIVEGAGHNVHFEKPAAFAALLERMLFSSPGR